MGPTAMAGGAEAGWAAKPLASTIVAVVPVVPVLTDPEPSDSESGQSSWKASTIATSSQFPEAAPVSSTNLTADGLTSASISYSVHHEVYLTDSHLFGVRSQLWLLEKGPGKRGILATYRDRPGVLRCQEGNCSDWGRGDEIPTALDPELISSGAFSFVGSTSSTDRSNSIT